MSLSEAGICNLALLRVGQRQLIDSLAESTTEAQLCAAVYAHCRDVVLSSHQWRFASRRAVLALTSLERTGWAYVYSLPGDCLVPRILIGPQRFPALEESVAFTIEEDATFGRVLLTDQESAELSYTYAVSSTGLFPPLFTDALVARLATELAFSLPVKPALAQGLNNAYRQALYLAIASDLNQSATGAPKEGESIRERL